MIRLPLLAVVLVAAPALAAEAPNPQIDYSGFQKLASDVAPYREARLISWKSFVEQATLSDTLILDARSASAYEAGHLKGAINLPLTEFTSESLARVIGRADRPILIYCNNNFSNNVRPVPLKNRALALNIQTFINLVGYGYGNVRELNEVIDFNSADVSWVRRARS